MQILRTAHTIPSEYRHAALAIGNFDGVHLGHQALLKNAVAHAQKKQVSAIAMTFHPHPRAFFSAQREPRAVDPFHIKCRRIKALGVHAALVIPFNTSFAAMSAEDFMQDIIIGSLNVSSLTVGHDFCFGAKRRGTISMLREAGKQYGFAVHSIGAQQHGNDIISSSRIRSLLSEGSMEQAAAMLGRPYQIYGRVRHGDKRGRTIGTPTANIAFSSALHPPKYGVYAVQFACVKSPDCASHPPQWKNGIANFGILPTFGGTDPRLELHAFEDVGDIYGVYIRVRLLHFVREERAFEHVTILQQQIQQDIADAKAFHQSYKQDRV